MTAPALRTEYPHQIDYRRVLLHSIERNAEKTSQQAGIHGVGSSEALRAAVDTTELIIEYRQRFMQGVGR